MNLTSIGQLAAWYGQHPAKIEAKLCSVPVEANLIIDGVKYYDPGVVEKVLDPKTTKKELEMIAFNRQDNTLKCKLAALAISGNLPQVERHFSQETLEAADRYRGLGLQEFLINAAEAGGYDGGRMAITSGNIRPILQAAFSTHSVTTMISDLGNKFLLSGFDMDPQTWREVAAIRSVKDFKQTTAYRLTTDLEYERLAPAGEIKHGTFGQDSYTMQARTYAKMLTLTREDIINDDLGAFDDLRRRLGLGAARALNNAFWKVWLEASDAGDFWSEERGNLAVVGAGITDEGIAAALKKFRNMTSADGQIMNLNPTTLLCGPSLEPYALKFYNASEIRNITSDSLYPTANIWQKRFLPVSEPRLENADFPGYSATTWWLCAKPSIISPAVVCFLDGREYPTVESADADFNVLGIQLRGYHDFGVAMAEHNASVKCVVSE